jgi:hypothetical protein
MAKKYKVIVYYEHWSQEDLEAGETDDQGTEYEDVDTLADVIHTAKKYNLGHERYSEGLPVYWKSTYFEAGTRDEFESGKDSYYTMFLSNEDGTPLSRTDFDKVNVALGGRPSKGNPLHPKIRRGQSKVQWADLEVLGYYEGAGEFIVASEPQILVRKAKELGVVEVWAGGLVKELFPLGDYKKARDCAAEMYRKQKAKRKGKAVKGRSKITTKAMVRRLAALGGRPSKSNPIKRFSFPKATNDYAIVNRATGEHVATVGGSTFTLLQHWIPQNLGVGDWLVFLPRKTRAGRAVKRHEEPVSIRVKSRGEGKRITYLNRALRGDEKLAPAGYGKVGSRPAPAGNGAKSNPAKGKRYHVGRVNDKTRKVTIMSAKPMSHAEAVTFMGAMIPNQELPKHLRNRLVEANPKKPRKGTAAKKKKTAAKKKKASSKKKKRAVKRAK